MRKFVALSILMVALFAISSTLYCVEATDSVSVVRDKFGYQTIYWTFTSDDDGNADCETREEVHGMLWKVWLAPDPVDPVSGAYDIDLYETVDFDAITTGRFTADLAAGLITSTTGELKAITVWPSTNVAVGSRVRLSVTGAEDSGGLSAKGKVVAIFAPTSSE